MARIVPFFGCFCWDTCYGAVYDMGDTVYFDGYLL